MSFQNAVIGLALAGLAASATPSYAVTGAGGPDLPEYARALGTIENGPSSTGMSVEEARRVIAKEQGQSAIVAPAAPTPARRHHHHRSTQPR